MNGLNPTPEQLEEAHEDKPDPVLEAFRMELRSYVDKPLTAKSLRQILQVAEAGRELLAVRDPRKRFRGRRRHMGGSTYEGVVQYNPGYGSDCNDDYGDYDEDEEGVGQGLGTQASPGRMNLDRETFGARIIRELVAVIPNLARAQREDPAQIVAAIAVAEKEGMTALANQLRAKLLPEGPFAPTQASQPADNRSKEEQIYLDAEKSVWAAKLPKSNEYIIGPAPLNVVASLASEQHEIVNTETGLKVPEGLLAKPTQSQGVSLR